MMVTVVKEVLKGIRVEEKGLKSKSMEIPDFA